MQIKINNKTYEARDGEMILDVCRREDIKISTLCAFDGLPKEAVCRLCLVEINLTDKLVPACAFGVCEKLEVVTESEKIEKARRINLELLWADHAGKCVKCRKNRMCELQNLAEEYKIENFHFVPRKEEITDVEEIDLLKDNKIRVVIDDKNPAVFRTTEYCIECRRCINICPEKKFGFNYRAGDTVVGTPYEKTLECSFCGKCIEACPTAALTDQNDFSKIIQELDDIKKMAVAAISFGAKENINRWLKALKSQKDFDKLLKTLGFEKIIYFSKEDLEDEEIKKVKNNLAQEEKINLESLVIFYISNNIKQKAEKTSFIDYVLTGREVVRLARDRKII